MPEPRQDMFPEHTDGEVEISPKDGNEAVVESAPIAPVTPPVPSTPKEPVPSAGIPYDKYHEVLKEKKRLEARVAELENSPASDGLPYDESHADGDLRGQVALLTKKLGAYERSSAMNQLLTTYPQLVDKIEEFDSFLESSENKILPIQTAAKIFLVDNNLLTQVKLPPKGLEKPSGGGARAVPKTGMTIDDSERLRKNDPRKWIEMARKGLLPDDALI